MIDILPPWPLFFTFLLASFVLAVTPGPGVLYIVTRSFIQGRCAGLISVPAVALGNLGNALAASLGLAALFSLSSMAFQVVKYAGALYLVYLGMQMLRSAAEDHATASLPVASLHSIFRDGFVVALLNPKTAIFFAAFLPQFVDPTKLPVAQSILLGSIFVAIAAVTDCCYAVAAGRVSANTAYASKSRRTGNYLGAFIFVGLGIFTALCGNRGAK